MATWLLLLVLTLGTYRITRLLVKDDFPPIRAPREWIKRHGPEWTAELVTCPWCVSGWVSMAAVAAAAHYGNVPLPVLCWPAVWAGAAWIAHHERDNPNVTVVSARAAVDYPSDEAMLAHLRKEWGTTGLVREALGNLHGEQRNHVLAAVAEWSGRRVDAVDDGQARS